MSETGSVSISISEGVGTVAFYHPKSNSLPGNLLRELAQKIDQCAADDRIRVIVLRSRGEKAFCAGASFAELQALSDETGGKAFFMGFATLILAMKKCPKFIIARVQGKTVGGGVGLVATADYALAHERAAVKLSELAVGLGPFVVGPSVHRKMGLSGFSELSIDAASWRDARWARERGLFMDVLPSLEALDEAVNTLAARLAQSNPEAMARLKAVFWEGTETWDDLLERRAEISGKLALSEFTSKFIASFGK